jgi:O-antigen ligase
MVALNNYIPATKIYKAIYFKYIAAFAFGMAMGYRVLPNPIVAILFLGIAVVCFVYGVQEKFEKLFSWLPFIVYTEPYMRGYVRTVPYLSLQYLYLGIFGVLFLKHIKDKKPHSTSFILLVLFGLIEVVNGLFPNDAREMRPILVQSLSLVVVVTWASFNTLSPSQILKLLTQLKVAAIYLTGIVLVAHLRGGISYNTESNFGSSNGMAPVQLSGYLGLGSILFMFSFLNPQEAKYRLLNLILFITCCTVMVLTFSRGGLYFLGIVMAFYLYFNKANMASYFKLILFVPVAFLIYYMVTEQTDGAIVKRYNKKGSSNRDVLVEAGIKLFLDEPILGVGTSNFNQEIVKRKYFFQSSTAHNEFIRAMAEHGIFGLVLYWGFFIVLIKNILQRTGAKKEFSFYFTLLFCLIVVHNGLKVSIQPLLLMMAVANPETLTSFARKKTISSTRLQHQLTTA